MAMRWRQQTGRGASRPDGPRRRRLLATTTTALLATGLLAGCGSGGKPVLNWYVNPDGLDTLTKLAKDCSTGQYDIDVQLLPSSATDQRTQLARRLAARDSSTDLMSLDPVFVPEFANAGWLVKVPDTIATGLKGGDVLSGALDTVTWDNAIYAMPQWANTQVLWYRKSLAQAAGLDMSKPVTWDQVIKAASAHNGSVGVQANKYEGYTVWINALVQGAGGDIVSDTEAGPDAKVDIDSSAGRTAAQVIHDLAHSSAAQPDLSISNEGTSLGRMYPGSAKAPQGAGEFMVNWTFVYKNYEGLVGQSGGPADKAGLADLGWARYPTTVAGTASKPPVGGIDIGVGAYSHHTDWAVQAARCVTTTAAQTQLALKDGLMPSTRSAYTKVAADGSYPKSLLDLFRTSVDQGGPRPKSAYYAEISGAIQERWHSPESVDPSTTPGDSAQYLSDVLQGKALL